MNCLPRTSQWSLLGSTRRIATPPLTPLPTAPALSLHPQSLSHCTLQSRPLSSRPPSPPPLLAAAMSSSGGPDDAPSSASASASAAAAAAPQPPSASRRADQNRRYRDSIIAEEQAKSGPHRCGSRLDDFAFSLFNFNFSTTASRWALFRKCMNNKQSEEHPPTTRTRNWPSAWRLRVDCMRSQRWEDGCPPDPAACSDLTHRSAVAAPLLVC